MREVESAIETAWKLGNVDIECELLVLELEHFVFRLAGEKIHAGTNVSAGRAGGALCDELHGESIARSGNAINTAIVRTIDSAVLSASSTVRAYGGIPFVTSITIGISACDVSPPPISIEDDGSLYSLATSTLGAFLPGHGRVLFSLISPDLLTVCNGKQGK
jgi:hypothetical protein